MTPLLLGSFWLGSGVLPQAGLVITKREPGLAGVVPVDDIEDVINRAVANAKGPIGTSVPAQTPSLAPTPSAARD